MPYVYIENGLDINGWGVYGVFNLKAPAEPCAKDPDYVAVSVEDMIVGNGPGWGDNTITDTEWLKRACELVNKYGLKDET